MRNCYEKVNVRFVPWQMFVDLQLQQKGKPSATTFYRSRHAYHARDCDDRVTLEALCIAYT